MRLYIPDMTDFFAWMDAQGYRYAVLRSFTKFDQGYPALGGKEDIDMLVEDRALMPVYARYHAIGRKSGVKCDLYNATGADRGGYLGGSYYPPALAEEILSTRRRWKNLFYVPGAMAHLRSLLYHVAYHKAELSKMHLDDETQSQASKYIPDIKALMEETGVSGIPMTLMGIHAWLKSQGLGLSPEALARFAQNDFSRLWKHVGMLYCQIAAEQKGEMNLFVIRSVAVETETHHDLINFLREHYQILVVKDLPLVNRVLRGRRMRGGKWRRGGYPAIAVIVYDENPVATTAEHRKVHPFVLNGRQFVKREWREWFTKKTGKKASANPIHSTDNEAEALAHLPLFFSPHEEEDLLDRLARLRGAKK